MVKMEVPARRDFVEPELRFEKYESIAFLPTDFGEEPKCKRGAMGVVTVGDRAY